MKQINRHLKTTFIFSTHDQKVIDQAYRLVKIEDGYITAFGVRNEQDISWNLAKTRNPHEPDATVELPLAQPTVINLAPEVRN